MIQLLKNIIKTVLLFSLIAINSIYVKSQNQNTSSFTYNTNDYKNNQYVMQIIKKLASYNNKTNEQISVTYNIFEKAEIIYNNNNEGICKLMLNITSFNGDTAYKNFSLRNVLLPSKIKYVFSFAVNDNILSSEYICNTKELTKHNNFNFDILLHKSLNSKSEFIKNNEIKIRSFIIDTEYINDFDNYIRLINEYYKYSNEITNCIDTLNSFNIDSINLLASYNKELIRIDNIIKKISNSKFSDILNLKAKDPENFLQKFEILINISNNIRKQLAQSFSNLDYIYTQKGIEQIKLNNLKEAENFFNLTLQFNPDYIPAKLEIIKLNFKLNNEMAGVDSLINMFFKQEIKDENKSEALEIATIAKSLIINKGTNLLIKEDYTSAISIFDKGIDFCNIITSLDCNDDMSQGLKKAKTGLYLSYIKVSNKALNNNRLDMAETYLNMAKSIKQNSEIIDNNEDNKLLEQLINVYIQKGIKYLNQKLYDNSAEQFDIAKKLSYQLNSSFSDIQLNQGIIQAKQGTYDEIIHRASAAIKKGNIVEAEKIIYSAIDFQNINSEYITNDIGTDTLFANINFKKYKNKIIEGKQLLTFGHFNEALSILSQAKELEKIWIFKKDKFLDTLLAQAAKPIILENLANAQIKVWGNDLKEAEVFYKTAFTMQYNYFLSADKIIETEINKLNNKLIERKCGNANEIFKKYYSQALKSIGNKDYALAGEYLDLALNAVIDYPECDISAEKASEKKNEYLHAITYQNLISNAIDGFYAQDYYTTLSNYLDAGKYFYDNNISNTGLIHKSINEFFIFHDNTNFLLYCINFFSEQKKYNEALSMLKILKNKKIFNKQTNTLQKQLGFAMGLQDAEQYNNKKPSILLFEYTHKDKYFNSFHKAYNKAWRKTNSIFNIF